MIELGQTVGNYRITAKLGEGGMGVVYLAEHPVIGRKAALKVIHPQHSRDAEVVARFINEASALSRIGHEHIVEVTDLGRTPGGDLYFVMEYLEGRPLSELVAREAPLSPPRALAIAAQIAEALAASHDHGIVHRDIKPDNVLLVTRGQDTSFVKVLDFGLAKLVHGDGPAVHDSRAGIVMGTPYYMSPEQCRGDSAIDARADIYALGVVLFEMLTGRLPFAGGACGDVLLKQVSMKPPSARDFVRELPDGLDAVLARALAKTPAERFGTMAAFREALLPRAAPRTTWPRALLRAGPHPRGEAPVRPPTTLGHGAGEVEDREAFDRVPRHRAGAFALAAAAAIAGTLLAAGLTRDGSRLAASATAASATAPPAVVVAPVIVPARFVAPPDAGSFVDADVAPAGTTLETSFQNLR